MANATNSTISATAAKIDAEQLNRLHRKSAALKRKALLSLVRMERAQVEEAKRLRKLKKGHTEVRRIEKMHWKVRRDAERAKALADTSCSNDCSYKELAESLYTEFQNLRVTISPDWSEFCLQTGLSPRTRYLIQACVDEFCKEGSWDFYEERVLTQAALRFALRQKAKRILRGLEDKGERPYLAPNFLAEFMFANRLNDHEIVEFIRAVDRHAVRDRGPNSPYQPDFWVMWDVFVALPYVEGWMKDTLYRVLAARRFLYRSDKSKLFVSLQRPGNKRALFDACKAWKISILFPKKIAVRIGRLPLWKRIVGGQIIHALMQERCGLEIYYGGQYTLENEDWSTPEFINEFWQRFSQAVSCGRIAAISSFTPRSRCDAKRYLTATVDDKELAKRLLELGFSCPKLLIGIKIRALKEVLRLTRFYEEDYSGNHLLQCYIAIVAIFGNNWKAFLEKAIQCRWSDEQTKPAALATLKNSTTEFFRVYGRSIQLHDIIYWVTPNASPAQLRGLDRFILKWMKHAPVGELSTVLQNWQNLDEEVKKHSSFKAVLAEAKSSIYYSGALDKGFALEAAKWSLPSGRYTDVEKIYLEALDVPTPFGTESFREGQYVARFLPRTDVRIGFFGHYTNCCQHWTGVGASCAISSVRDPFAQLFIVEKDGDILAGSWVWETHNQKEGKLHYSGVCFDNVEAKGLSSEQHEIVLRLYKRAADYLVSLDYVQVTVGTGLCDLNVNSLEFATRLTLPSEYSGYSDATQQKLLAIDSNPSKYYEGLHNKVWVRGALESDFRALNRIAASCYHDGWAQEAALPDDPADAYGFILESFSNGPIGYAVLDVQNKYVCDIAVLKEERRHSTVLIDKTLNFMKKAGGVWTADAKADTSYRLLSLYDRRGRLSLKTIGVSHKVDGQDCYNVEIAF